MSKLMGDILRERHWSEPHMFLDGPVWAFRCHFGECRGRRADPVHVTREEDRRYIKRKYAGENE